jgi:hypothetical protein
MHSAEIAAQPDRKSLTTVCGNTRNKLRGKTSGDVGVVAARSRNRTADLAHGEFAEYSATKSTKTLSKKASGEYRSANTSMNSEAFRRLI